MASICIMDCEMYFNTSPIPNVKAMKISSYHKQKNDSVIMLQPGDKIRGRYNIIYVIREYMSTPFPPTSIMDSMNIKLIGKAFEGYDSYTDLDATIMSVRPDYTLYTGDSMYHMAQYAVYTHNFYILKKTQDFHRSSKFVVRNPLTIVADENLWLFPEEYVVSVLKQLQEEKNIYFLHPIKLSKLTSSENIRTEFYKLHFTKKLKINYINDLGNSFEKAKKIIDFLNEFQAVKNFINISPPSFKIITKDHWKDNETAILDFENCLRIMSYAIEKNVRIRFQYPRYRLITPLWSYFEFFRTWSLYYHRLSYIEALLKPTCKKFQVKEYELLNDIRYWKDNQKLKQIVHLLCTYPDLMKECAFNNWFGEDKIYNKLDIEYIKEHEHEFNIFRPRDIRSE